MSLSRSTPSLVPNSDFAVYIVLDDFGKAGLIYREAASEDTTLAAVINDIITGQYSDPYQIVAFNTAEGWSRDVTEDVARDILDKSIREDIELRGPARDLVERETGATLPAEL
jgi:hypothetical protein